MLPPPAPPSRHAQSRLIQRQPPLHAQLQLTMALWPHAVTQFAYACFDFLKEMATTAAAATVAPVTVAALAEAMCTRISLFSLVRSTAYALRTPLFLCGVCLVSRHVQHNARARV